MDEFEKTELNILLRLQQQNVVQKVSNIHLDFLRNFEEQLSAVNDFFTIDWCKVEERRLFLLLVCETDNRNTVIKTRQLLSMLDHLKIYERVPEDFGGIFALCNVDNFDICFNVIFLSSYPNN